MNGFWMNRSMACRMPAAVAQTPCQQWPAAKPSHYLATAARFLACVTSAAKRGSPRSNSSAAASFIHAAFPAPAPADAVLTIVSLHERLVKKDFTPFKFEAALFAYSN
jgi:hypothetical protein